MNGRVTACVRPPHFLPTCIILLAVLLCYNTAGSQGEDLTVPVIADGQTQEIPQFKDPDFWIRHDLRVETEFDSDGDGKLDRMHVDVTRLASWAKTLTPSTTTSIAAIRKDAITATATSETKRWPMDSTA